MDVSFDYINEKLIEIRNDINNISTELNILPARLVAVSKMKPVELIQYAYDSNQRHFGENYVQELVEKSATLPNDIKWHFIGHLQSNKVNTLLTNVSNLYIIETVDRIKIAKIIEKNCNELDITMNIYIQINTSNESTKSGILPSECNDFVLYILNNCPHLNILGLMTIGAPNDFNCFDILIQCKDNILTLPEMENKQLELSMGMSNDYLEALQRGSNNIRVGSKIFGARDYSNRK